MVRVNIKPDDFRNGGEIDITAHYGEGRKKGRLSIRQRNNRYEVYVHWFIEKIDEVLHKGTLQECVSWTNARVGLNDQVQ